MKKLICTLMMASFVSLSANANCAKGFVQSYAHPGLFGSQSQVANGATADTTYVLGGKALKTRHGMSIKNKEHVFVAHWANSMLDLMRVGQENGQKFDVKGAVLRSELAVVLADAFDLQEKAGAKNFPDVAKGYWAESQINAANEAGIMIGYPEGVFKPDQKVTKAEFFATIAKILDMETSDAAPVLNGKKMAYIPQWAYRDTNEVINSGLLTYMPDKNAAINNQYLSKEQAAFIVGDLKYNLAYYKKLRVAQNAPKCCCNAPVAIKVKMNDRISAKTANAGECFTATVTEDVVINGVAFPAGSLVRGKVKCVQRPGYENPGFVKVKFTKIENKDTELAFPKDISEVRSTLAKNPNVIARVLGFPFSATARVAGVSGRYVAGSANIVSNRTEEFGDYVGGIFVEGASLKPAAAGRSFGNSLYTVGKGVFDLTKIFVNGVFGVLYEFGDELVYVFAPGLSNDSSLNPNEELVILF